MNQIARNSFHLLILGVTLFIFSCSQNPKNPDISSIQLNEIKILQLEQDLFNTTPGTFKDTHPKMLNKYGRYYESFIYGVINNGGVSDSVYQTLDRFITDKDMRKVYEAVNRNFTNEKIIEIEKDLNLSMKYFKYHFPNKPLPKKIVSYISGFNFNITSIDSVLGIGLDMYLGEKEPFYQMLQWPKYKVRTMSSEYISVEAMKGWLIHSFDNKEPGNNLLSHMIFFGKLHYANELICPSAPDSMIIAYNTEQMKYCQNFEKELWSYFTQKDLLYTSDLKKISEYTAEGPFTSAINKDCPPRIAHWIGWQIVRKYMSKNTNVGLTELMNEEDANKILSASKYKP